MAWMRTRRKFDFHRRCIPTTRMIQVNLRSTNTRVVRADPPPLPPKSSWTGGAAVDADPNWPTRRGNATRVLKNQWGSTRRRRRRHFVLGPIPGEDPCGNQIFGAPPSTRRCRSDRVGSMAW